MNGKARSPKSNVIPLSPRKTEALGGGVSADLPHLLSRWETEVVLDSILEKAFQSTNADGGSIYFIDRLPQESFGGARPAYKKILRFYRTVTRAEDQVAPLHDTWIELSNKSIAGYVALSGKFLNIPDVAKIPKNAEYQFLDRVDQETGYVTRSLLTVPIVTGKGDVVGVVQLINKLKTKTRKKGILGPKDVSPFTELDEQIMDALASQAGIALENAKLTQDIEKLFESFVRASVTAIEQRDPSTSGHSDRVAIMTVDFAKAIDLVNFGPLGDVRFSRQQLQEIRYASLLHDFGKIGVRENVLLKAKKLYPNELETVLLRMDTMKAKNEAILWRLAAEKVSQNTTLADHEISRALWQIDQFNQKLEKIRHGIMKANESQVLEKDFDIKSMIDWLNEQSSNIGQLVLNPEEIRRLSIPRGTLDEGERKEIESHVSHTFQFLSQIAWTENLANVPDIAHGHHEKLDGTGYPLGLQAEQIPLQSRMMAIADIFDALTAMDRPYKKAITTERALDILHLEAGEGKLDQTILKVFVEAKVYQGALDFSRARKKKAG